MKMSFTISEVTPYINWIYFFHAWGAAHMPALDKVRLQAEAEKRLLRYDQRYQTHAVFRLFPAYSSGDDIIVRRLFGDDGPMEVRIPCLRQQQQGSKCLCLSDFIAPARSSHHSQVAIFATSVDEAMEHDFDDDPYEKMMMQLLADRLAEAAAERLHEKVRKVYWGYARYEHLTIPQMLNEQWQGIRPAVGYPSLPDTSLNFVFNHLINFRQIGIRLTDTGAMKPHASVSGMMISHPEACYFSVGTIGEDQLNDYARRRGIPVTSIRKYLASNLA